MEEKTFFDELQTAINMMKRNDEFLESEDGKIYIEFLCRMIEGQMMD